MRWVPASICFYHSMMFFNVLQLSLAHFPGSSPTWANDGHIARVPQLALERESCMAAIFFAHFAFFSKPFFRSCCTRKVPHNSRQGRFGELDSRGPNLITDDPFNFRAFDVFQFQETLPLRWVFHFLGTQGTKSDQTEIRECAVSVPKFSLSLWPFRRACLHSTFERCPIDVFRL